MALKLTKATVGVGSGQSTIFEVERLPLSSQYDGTKNYKLMDSERGEVIGGYLKLSMTDLRTLYELLGIMFDSEN